MSHAPIKPKSGFFGHSGNFYTDSEDETSTPEANTTRRKNEKPNRGTRKKHYPPKGLDNNYDLDDDVNPVEQKKPMPSATIFPVDYDVKIEDDSGTSDCKSGGRKSSMKRQRKSKKHKKRRTRK